jgi:putative nucleotidyltransferase with HDIG domain
MTRTGEGDAERKGLIYFPSEHRWWRVGVALLVGLVVMVVLTLVLVVPLSVGRTHLQVGQVADQTVLAPRKVTYVSQVLTNEAQRRAEMSVPDVYDPPDPRIARAQVTKARQALDQIDAIRGDSSLTLDEKVAAIAAIPDLKVPTSIISQTLALDDADWHAVMTETLFVLNQVMRSPIREDGVTRARQMLPGMIDLSLSDQQAEVVAALAGNFVQANSLYNAEATKANQEAAAQAVEPQKRTIERGEAIVRQGDIVTSLDVEALQALGLEQAGLNWYTVAGVGLLIAVFITVLSLYLLRLHPDFWKDQRGLALSAIVLVAFAVGAKFMVPGHTVLPYLFPLAAASMLLTTLVGPRFALTGALVLSVYIGLMAGGSLELMVYFLAGSVIASVAVWRIERLAAFIWAGVYVTLANLAVVAAYRIQTGTFDTLGALQLAAGAIGNGALSASLTVAGFFVLGNLFSITTSIQLMELARPTHPLLRQLQMKAPGTYHHSLVISNLAEQAAQQIGADALLVRVGAYYHDVGKSVRPYFFVENQVDGVNVHERLDPRTSAQIVIAHVTDGLELAKKYGLPQSIRDFIAQHHGNRLASFFYQQAVKDADGQPVDEADFRYPGPRPQSRETAILMLADSVEAAVRAARPQSVEDIDRVVRKIMGDRLIQGDLDECDLTLRDLEQIREVFVSILQGVYHPRLQYPEEIRPRAALQPASAPLSDARTSSDGEKAGEQTDVKDPGVSTGAQEPARGTL